MLVKKFIGFSTVGKTAQGTKLTDVDLIKQDLTNHFSIRRGEKLENPNFGTIIPYLLFEPLTDEVIKAIEDDVVKIVNFDPRCRLNVISVEPNAEGNGVVVDCEIVFVPFSFTGAVSWEFTNEGYIRMVS